MGNVHLQVSLSLNPGNFINTINMVSKNQSQTTEGWLPGRRRWVSHGGRRGREIKEEESLVWITGAGVCNIFPGDT